MREEYGILDEDVYNFDETGFAMGVARAGSSKVVTASTSVGCIMVIQPGNCKWVTVIECINASGWALPPFVILEGKVHLTAWYKTTIPSDWTITVSENGWTNDALGFQWIQHFDKWTKQCTTGKYRLLILDGHGSHATPEFDQFCSDNQIITLCMPPHTSHLLQPLDVACFSPVKKAYGQLVQQLAHQSIFHVDKTDFLEMYEQACKAIHSEKNILGGFHSTGLIPFSPECVLSTLTITKTPSPPSTSHGQQISLWTSETPKNPAEVIKQMQLVHNTLQHQSQSPTEPLAKVAKSASIAWGMVALQAEELAELRASNERLQRKKRQTKQHLQSGGVLQVQEARQLIQACEEVAQARAAPVGQASCQQAPRTCSCCGSREHTACTCNLVNSAG